ncbi:MAG: alpha/beta hydrolase [Candidatus Binatia bacterium]
MRDHTLRVPGGRGLRYLDLGDPRGRVVVSCHGGLSSRLDVAFADGTCATRGLRLLAIDRPGIGGSDPSRGRTLLDWPADVRTLADALGVDRFAVLGWSAGGPYALACGHVLHTRVTRVATVAGMGPIDHPGGAAALGLLADRLLFPLARRAPRVAMLVLRLVRRLPAALLCWSLVRELSPADRRAVSRLQASEVTAPTYEALRAGVRGTVEDYRLLGGPWGFRPEDVPVEVVVWQGADDRLVPRAHAEALARRLPRSRLVVVPARGHFLWRTDMPAILGSLSA